MENMENKEKKDIIFAPVFIKEYAQFDKLNVSYRAEDFVKFTKENVEADGWIRLEFKRKRNLSPSDKTTHYAAISNFKPDPSKRLNKEPLKPADQDQDEIPF